MNSLLHLQDKIRSTTAALGKLETELQSRPNSPALYSNILSLRKLHQNLRDDFQDAANELGMDVCHYRMLNDLPTAKSFARAIGGFQDAFALAYDALRNGPKARRNISSAAVQKTELRVAYSYPGSFGVVFTIPNPRLLLEVPTYLEEAAATVFAVAKSKDNAGVVLQIAKQIGRGPIIGIYDWAKANAQSGTGAAIDWLHDSKVKENVVVQAPEFKALSDSLERTSEEVVTEDVYRGVLVGADTKSRRFHFIADGAEQSIRGKFEDAISESQQAQLPARYTAVVRKMAQLAYSTEVEKVSYFLIRLEPSQ
jgi:hypothetical protein